MVTIFTPTYNRGTTIPRLYESLLKQTDKRFEWLVIDDGSTDNTEELISSYIADGKVNISYVKRENWGLSQTINQGIDLAKGDIFFRVDSDDFVSNDAVELINTNWSLVASDDKLCGIAFLKSDIGNMYAPHCPFNDNVRTNFTDYYYRQGGSGDLAAVIKTDVFRKNKIPKFGEERFCPEGIVWNRISFEYDVLFVPKIIYLCEYRNDGITVNARRNMRKNAIGVSTFFSEMFEHKLSLFHYVKTSISFWRIAYLNKKGFSTNFQSVPLLASILGLPFGTFLCVYDEIKSRIA